MAGYKNIVGTPFLDYVQDQIEARTKLLNKKDRSSSDLQYATNRNSWLRLSSAAIISPLPPDQLIIRDLAKSDTDLQAEQANLDSTFVTDLAQTNILQGGTISAGGDKTVIKKGFNQTYTQGATDQLGFKPMPGITNVTVGTGGKWQTLMQAEVEFICYDLDQLDLMTKLYMSLGVTLFLEWGHTPYLDNEGKLQTNVRPLDFFSPNFNTKEKLLQEVTKKRENSFGNYDGILGTVYNFSWSANNDGSYNCKTQIMGPGGMVESLRINTSNNIDLDEEEGEESEKYRSVLENALFSIKKYLKSSIGVITAVTKNGDYEDRGAGTNSTKGFQKVTLLDKSVAKSTREKFSDYGQFLNSIYKQSTYKGPKFTTSILPNSSNNNPVEYYNANSQFGNAWQKIAGIEDNNLSPLPSNFYDGYIGYFKSFEDDSSLFNTYITFGHLMSLVQHLGIFSEGDSSSSESKNLKPIVYIDYNPSNTTILRGALEASIDPTTCVIPWFVKGSVVEGKKRQTLKPFFSPLDVASTSTPNWYGGSNKDGNILKNFLAYPEKNAINEAMGNGSFEGKLFDVLINIDFALNKLKSLSSGADDRSVSLISFIDAILDGINLSLGKANNFRAFADPLYPVIRIIDENVIEIPTKFLEVPIYGTKSIVYDYGFSSKITPKLASQIVIATQGLQNGGIKGFPDDVLSYQKLNNDVRDRFSKTKFPAVKPSELSSNQNEEKNTAKSLQKLYDHIYNVYSNEEDKSLSSATISNLTTFYSDLQNKQRKLSKSTNNGGILLPIEYTLTLDGISGILPYNAFKIPDNRLPKKYRGRVAFAIFSINHSFSNNQWTTNLRGQTLLLDQTPIVDTRKLSETPEKRAPQPQLTAEEQEAINTTYPGVVNTTAFELTQTPNPSAVGTQSDLDQEPPTQTGTINPTTTVNPIATAQENDVPAILNFLRAQEGFETSSYDDRGSLRIGFGSDTITRTNGNIESVKPNSIVNEAEANLDLQRRVTQEFKPKVQARCRELGVDYNQLPLKVKVVFVDCAYNYGSLWYDIIRSYINGGVNGLIDELQRRANQGASQVPSRRAAEIKYLQG